MRRVIFIHWVSQCMKWLQGRFLLTEIPLWRFAIKHLQEEMVPPSVYTPDLPYSLEQIILKCTQKSVDRRYSRNGGCDRRPEGGIL